MDHLIHHLEFWCAGIAHLQFYSHSCSLAFLMCPPVIPPNEKYKLSYLTMKVTSNLKNLFIDIKRMDDTKP